MSSTRNLLVLASALALLAACNDKPSSGHGSATSTVATADAPAPTNAAPKPVATPPATATETSAPAKTYDCGAKGQKPCPMQGWMKRVMAPASSADDAAALAKALAYVADHPPPGFTDWTSLANAGVAKAKAGDVDGAKGSCKPCHDEYKDRYKASMRDRAF